MCLFESLILLQIIESYLSKWIIFLFEKINCENFK